MNDSNIIQALFWILIVISSFVCLVSFWVIRYYAAKPINGEEKTLKRHDKTIEDTKKVINNINKKMTEHQKVWKIHP